MGCCVTRDGRDNLAIDYTLARSNFTSCRPCIGSLPENLERDRMGFLDGIVGGVSLMAHLAIIYSRSTCYNIWKRDILCICKVCYTTSVLYMMFKAKVGR